MRYCPECEEKTDEDDVNYICPFCGEENLGGGFYICENCGKLFDFQEFLWECEFCHKGSETQEDDEYSTYPSCGEVLDDDEYCCDCDWPNNQGWIGENYG